MGDTAELKAELVKKDDLIKRHYEKLGQWKTMLSDVQGQSSSNQLPSARPHSLLAPPSHQGHHAGPKAPTLPAVPTGQPSQHGGFVSDYNYARMPGQQHTMIVQQNPEGPLAYLERTASNIGGPGPGGVIVGNSSRHT